MPNMSARKNISSGYEKRALFFEGGNLEVKQNEGDSKQPIIVGVAAVFGTRSPDMGGFTEEIALGAFDESIDKGNIVALAHHQVSLPIATMSNGSLQLSIVGNELRAIITPKTSTASLLIEQIEAGLVDGMSVGLRNASNQWSYEDGINRRIITKAELLEVSVVNQPVWDETSVALRSLLAFKGELKDIPLDLSLKSIEEIKGFIDNINVNNHHMHLSIRRICAHIGIDSPNQKEQ